MCKSADHPSAMHSDTLSENIKQHEGEKEKTAVKTTCTDICDTSYSTKSYAIVLLVNVYPTDKKWLSVTTSVLFARRPKQQIPSCFQLI